MNDLNNTLMKFIQDTNGGWYLIPVDETANFYSWLDGNDSWCGKDYWVANPCFYDVIVVNDHE